MVGQRDGGLKGWLETVFCDNHSNTNPFKFSFGILNLFFQPLVQCAAAAAATGRQLNAVCSNY